MYWGFLGTKEALLSEQYFFSTYSVKCFEMINQTILVNYSDLVIYFKSRLYI